MEHRPGGEAGGDGGDGGGEAGGGAGGGGGDSVRTIARMYYSWTVGWAVRFMSLRLVVRRRRADDPPLTSSYCRDR